MRIIKNNVKLTVEEILKYVKDNSPKDCKEKCNDIVFNGVIIGREYILTDKYNIKNIFTFSAAKDGLFTLEHIIDNPHINVELED